MAKKKHVRTFQEFLENKKVELDKPNIKRVDWELRKNEWVEAVNTLYDKVDEIIVANFRKAGYNVSTQKKDRTIIEDFIGAYSVADYVLTTDSFRIFFNPVGTIIIGSKGRVDMILPAGTVKLILTDNNEWKIVKGFSVSMELVDFNEKNIQKVFEEAI